jgi:rod shape determining protein RodA
MAGIIILFFAGLSWKIISAAGVMTIVAVPLMYTFVLYDYQRRRIDTLFNPEADPLGAGWNIIQSQIAIGSGGLMGKGWLNGTQSRLDFLPESSTDFIFAVIAEELGLFGTLMVLGGFLFLVLFGIQVALAASDMHGAFLAGGISAWFGVQAIVNVGGVVGVLPMTGLTLPFLSYGGSSMIASMAAVGLLLNVARYAKK